MAIGDPDVTGTNPGDHGSSVTGASAPASTDPVALSDTTLVRVPGRDDPVAWGDYMKGYRSTSDLDQARQHFDQQRQHATQLLLDRAKQLDERQRRFEGGGRPQTAPQTAADALSRLKGMRTVDGQTIVDLIEEMRAQGKPANEWAHAVNQYVGQFASKLNALESRLAPFETQTRDREITAEIDKGLAAAKIDLSAEGMGDGAAALKELATNVYYGWHPSRADFPEGAQGDQGYAAAVRDFHAEFPKLFTAHLEGVRKAGRLLDRLDADTARQRFIPSRGGSATPNGERPYTHLSAADMAHAFYQTRSPTMT